MGFPQIGQVLKNGHTVDAAYCVGDARYVLAHRDGEWEQFVVWSVDQDGDTVNGRYFTDPAAAQKKFAECCFDWWADLITENPQIVLEDQQTILESTMNQLRPVLQRALLKYGIPGTVSVDNPDAAEIAVSEDFSACRPDRQQTIQAVIRLIIERMEEKNKGNLTAKYVIGILQEAITHLESNALMKSARDCLYACGNACHTKGNVSCGGESRIEFTIPRKGQPGNRVKCALILDGPHDSGKWP